MVINPGRMVHQGYRSRLVCVCSKSPLECLYEKRYDMAGSSDQTFVVFSENAQYSSYGAYGIVWLWPLDIIISMLSFEGNNAKIQQGPESLC